MTQWANTLPQKHGDMNSIPGRKRINVAKLSSDLYTHIYIIHKIIKSSTPKYLLLERL